jgi:hypothetical protein
VVLGEISGEAGNRDEVSISELARDIAGGLVVYFVGAGVNSAPFVDGNPESSPRLPDARVLSRALATQFHYPLRPPCSSVGSLHLMSSDPGKGDATPPRCWPNEAPDLIKIAQIISSRYGSERLSRVMSAQMQSFQQPPTIVHALLSQIANRAAAVTLREATPFPLILTTNYDDVLERSIQAPYDLVYFGSTESGVQRKGDSSQSDPADASFWIKIHDEVPQVYVRSKDPKRESSRFAFCQSRPLIVKIHGTLFSKTLPGSGLLVLSEDDYIDFSVKNTLRLPATIENTLRSNSFFFLGYSLGDWNLRVFLRRLERLSGGQKEARSWSVMPTVNEIEREAWLKSANVEAIGQDFEHLVPALSAELHKAWA